MLKAKGGREVVPGEIPDNVLVRPRVPQLDVLERADVFVTHGGMNSTMEALYYGVPLVVVPQMADQYMIADRVETLGVGQSIDKDTFGGDQLQVVLTVDTDGYRSNAANLRQEMDTAGGIKRAVSIIEEAKLNLNADLRTTI